MSLAAKGLIEFVNPYKLPKFVKQVHLQMKELEGRQPFGQGLYHCNSYENLIKNLTATREKYRATSDISLRKQLATEEYQAWRQYIKNRSADLPDNHQFTEKQKNDLRRSFEVFIAKNEKGVKPTEMLNVFNDYTRVNQFTIPLDNWCVLQMINFNMGYLMNMNRLIQFEDVVDLVSTKVVATYERSLGQDLLFREICSFGYWNLFDKKEGFMSLRDFSNFVKIFKINVEPSGMLKEFGFAANLFQGEFKKEIDPKEDIVRFDFYRYLFLERNLMIWRKIEPQGKLPGDRAAHSCDLIQGKLYIFGGWNGMNALADIHIYDFNLNQWCELQTQGELPSYRNNHTTAVYSTKLYVHGGHNGNAWLDDLYYLETSGSHATWQKVHPQGQIPTARACHSLNLVSKKLYLFGGYDGQECFNEIEIFDIQENKWQQPQVTGSIPTARNAHTMTRQFDDYSRYKENLYLFGGHSGAQHLSDLHVFNTSNLEWTQVQTHGTLPKGLRGHTANLIQNNIYIFGGYDGSGRSNDLFIFNFLTHQWVIPNHHGTSTNLYMEEVALSQIPQPRQRHSATATENDLIYIFGGFDGNKWLNDLYVLDVGLLENRTIQEENYQRVITNIHQNLFNNPELSDVIFEVGDQKIYAHKICLAAQSAQFKALFFSGMSDSDLSVYQIKNYTFKSFYTFILFVYTGYINMAELDLELMGEILSLADQYLMDGLKNLMQKSIKKYITNDTVCDLLIFAQKCSAHSLKSACMNHLLKNITNISASPKYEKLELQPSLLTEITRALLSLKE